MLFKEDCGARIDIGQISGGVRCGLEPDREFGEDAFAAERGAEVFYDHV